MRRCAGVRGVLQDLINTAAAPESGAWGQRWVLRAAHGQPAALGSPRSYSVVPSCPTDAGQALTMALSNAESLQFPHLPSAA